MKLANGSGSIICLDKTGKKRRKPWAVRITAGWENGKQVRKYLGYYATQSDALIALAEYHKNSVDLDLTKLTLEDVYHKWIQRIEKKSSTAVVNNHKMCYQRFGILGKKQIKEIKTAHLQDWMDGIELKPSTKGKLKSTMAQIFEYAVVNDIILKNYAKNISIDEKIEKTGAIFTTEEIATLWKHADLDVVQETLILIYTGMRIGEALDITADKVNLEERYMIGGSKTEAGRDRIIPIHKAIFPFVEKRITQSKYLLHKKNKSKIGYTGVKRRFTLKMEELGMEHSLHDTRKTFVSLMHSANVPIEVIRIIVGHSGKGVTEKVYLYKEASELVEAVDKMIVNE